MCVCDLCMCTPPAGEIAMIVGSIDPHRPPAFSNTVRLPDVVAEKHRQHLWWRFSRIYSLARWYMARSAANAPWTPTNHKCGQSNFGTQLMWCQSKATQCLFLCGLWNWARPSSGWFIVQFRWWKRWMETIILAKYIVVIINSNNRYNMNNKKW